MNIIRIDIGLGDGGVDDDGIDLFKAEYSKRVEITAQDISPELKNYKKEILRLVNNGLKEIEQFGVDLIPESTLKIIDNSVRNLKKGKVSELRRKV